MDEYAILEAEREGPEALEAFKKMRQQYSPDRYKKCREVTRSAEEIEHDINQLEDELFRSREFLKPVAPEEIDKVFENIRNGITLNPRPRPVHVLELKIKQLNQELGRSKTFH